MAVDGTELVDVVSATVDEERLVTGQIASRFPVPPSALGFANDIELDLAFDRVASISQIGLFLSGALVPESAYLEPTTGQIWPR